MRKWIAAWALWFVVGIMMADAKEAFVLGVKRLDSRKVAVTCSNGGDPTGIKLGETLIIDCGK